MRFASTVLAAAIAAGLVCAAQEEKKPGPKGAPVVVIGCLSGNTLTVTGGPGRESSYALRGTKERMRAIRKEFEGTKVEVVGFAHDSRGATNRGMVVTSKDGKTRVTTNAREEVGIPEPTQLDVESVKKAGGPCR